MTDDDLKEGFSRVSNVMRDLCANGKQTNVSYTQETHDALKYLHAYAFDQIAKLEGRVKELEARGDAYKGVHQRALDYRKGDLVTHKGAVWAALRDCAGVVVPGSSPDAWMLAAKGTG